MCVQLMISLAVVCFAGIQSEWGDDELLYYLIFFFREVLASKLYMDSVGGFTSVLWALFSLFFFFLPPTCSFATPALSLGVEVDGTCIQKIA